MQYARNIVRTDHLRISHLHFLQRLHPPFHWQHLSSLRVLSVGLATCKHMHVVLIVSNQHFFLRAHNLLGRIWMVIRVVLFVDRATESL
jgi:hypothetical protein